MRSAPSNPFRSCGTRRLVQACERFTAELRARRPRSKAERERLAEDVAYLLLAIANRLGGPPGLPNAPEQLIARGAAFTESWQQVYMRGTETLRDRILKRAADLALGDAADDWFRALFLKGEMQRALGSDAALLKYLKELEREFIRRRSTSGPDAA